MHRFPKRYFVELCQSFVLKYCMSSHTTGYARSFMFRLSHLTFNRSATKCSAPFFFVILAFYMTRFVWNHLNLRRRHSHTHTHTQRVTRNAYDIHVWCRGMERGGGIVGKDIGRNEWIVGQIISDDHQIRNQVKTNVRRTAKKKMK